MPPPLIRPFAARDVPETLAMVQALAAHHGDAPSVTAQSLARDALGDPPWLRVLVAERDRVLLGYAALCPLAQLQYGVRGMDLHHLFVLPQARGGGLGRALIEAAQALCRDAFCAYMTVGTHPDNAAAAAIYRGLGFEELPPPGPRFRVRLP